MRRSDPNNPPLIQIVDDDDAVRDALTRLIESLGLRAEAFASPGELLGHEGAEEVACLLLDVNLPDMDGFELHERLVRAGEATPVIFITGEPDEPSREKARRAQAVAYLEKPLDDGALFLAIQTAVHCRNAGSTNPCSS